MLLLAAILTLYAPDLDPASAQVMGPADWSRLVYVGGGSYTFDQDSVAVSLRTAPFDRSPYTVDVDPALPLMLWFDGGTLHQWSGAAWLPLAASRVELASVTVIYEWFWRMVVFCIGLVFVTLMFAGIRRAGWLPVILLFCLPSVAFADAASEETLQAVLTAVELQTTALQDLTSQMGNAWPDLEGDAFNTVTTQTAGQFVSTRQGDVLAWFSGGTSGGTQAMLVGGGLGHTMVFGGTFSNLGGTVRYFGETGDRNFVLPLDPGGTSSGVPDWEIVVKMPKVTAADGTVFNPVGGTKQIKIDFDWAFKVYNGTDADTSAAFVAAFGTNMRSFIRSACLAVWSLYLASWIWGELSPRGT